MAVDAAHFALANLELDGRPRVRVRDHLRDVCAFIADVIELQHGVGLPAVDTWMATEVGPQSQPILRSGPVTSTRARPISSSRLAMYQRCWYSAVHGRHDALRTPVRCERMSNCSSDFVSPQRTHVLVSIEHMFSHTGGRVNVIWAIGRCGSVVPARRARPRGTSPRGSGARGSSR